MTTEVTSTPKVYHLDPLKVFDSLASGVSYTPGNDGITARSGNASALVAARRIDIACEPIPCAGVESSSKINSHSSSCVAPDTADCTQDNQESQETGDIQETEEGQEEQEINEIQTAMEITTFNDSLNATIDRAVESRSFAEETNRVDEDPLFDLARDIRTIESINKIRLAPNLLREVFNRWERRNLSQPDPEYDYTAFLEKLTLVKFGSGQGLVSLMNIARSKPCPKRAETLPKPVKDLARLCRELAHMNGGHFHLACAAAAQVLGVCANTALTYLRSLCAVGLIRLVTPAVKPQWRVQHNAQGIPKEVKEKGRATIYAYIED